MEKTKFFLNREKNKMLVFSLKILLGSIQNEEL